MKWLHTRLDGLLVGLVCVLLLAGCYLSTLAVGPTWANNASDSGELIAAAATLGVAHPSGYPTYLLLLRLAQSLLPGDLAARSHLFSAICMTLTALVVATMVRRLVDVPRWPTALASLVAALWFGMAPLVWSQAVVAEVYALNALGVGLCLLWLVEQDQQQTNLPVWHGQFVRGLVVGLALGNHLTVALPAVVWLAHGAWLSRQQRRLLVWPLAGVATGLLVYLYVPLRAAAQPPINWGGADSWQGFWWLLSGAPYRELAFGLPSEFLGNRVQAWAALLLRQFGVLGVGLGLAGLVYGAPQRQRVLWLMAALVVAYSVFAIAYNTADSFAYLLPVYLIFAVWIGCGAILVLQWVQRWQWGMVVVAVLLLALVGRTAWIAAPQVNASTDRRAVLYAEQVMERAPAHALVITSSDRDTFPLWYYHFALGERSDIAVVVGPLLHFTWYREHVQIIYPTLVLPEEQVAGWRAALEESNRGRGSVCYTDLDESLPLVCEND
jgi:hypothetical protein